MLEVKDVPSRKQESREASPGQGQQLCAKLAWQFILSLKFMEMTT